jgi:hypothetical protein
MTTQKTDVATRVRKHRQALRAAGLRPVQIWVPDSRRAGFAEECQRQSLLVGKSPHEGETLEWLGAGADKKGWK